MNRSSELALWAKQEHRFPKFCWWSGSKSFAAVGGKIGRTGLYGGLTFAGERYFVEPDEVRYGEFTALQSDNVLEPIEDFERWKQCIEQAKAAPYEKVVIARRFRTEVNCPYIFFESIVDAKRHNFLLALDPGTVFVGSSPELLFELRGNLLKTEALAGTRPLTGDAFLDKQLRSELLASSKERREHQIVSEFIAKATGLTPSSIEVRESKGVQHLLQRFEGITDLNWEDLLERLHPTPAVAGAPATFIRKIEGFDRGWYAGALGTGERFAVAIRSGLWKNGELIWYSGCGITALSDPLEEWEETAKKASVCGKIST